MTYLEKFILQKGFNKISEYMIGLGYSTCKTYANDNNKITFCNHPSRKDITVIFSEKGRAKQIIYEDM